MTNISVSIPCLLQLVLQSHLLIQLLLETLHLTTPVEVKLDRVAKPGKTTVSIVKTGGNMFQSTNPRKLIAPLKEYYDSSRGMAVCDSIRVGAVHNHHTRQGGMRTNEAHHGNDKEVVHGNSWIATLLQY